MLNQYKCEIKTVSLLILIGFLWFVARPASIDFLQEKYVEVPRQQHIEELAVYQEQFNSELAEGREIILYRQDLYLPLLDEYGNQNRENLLALLDNGYTFIVELGDKTLVFKKEKAGAHAPAGS